MELSISDRFVEEVSKIVIGRKEIIELMLVALLSQGHILLEGNPGLGKTILAKSFAQTIGGTFKRIQMTPDTLPADIIGTHIYDRQTNKFILHKGPMFANVILVDELNRATPKAQSALLESMQERQVSLEGETMRLNEPFIIIATQVAFGSAGTYPLSEVQSDRFTFSIQMGYPTSEEEVAIISKIDSIEAGKCRQILTLDETISSTESVREVYSSDAIRSYIVALANFLRKSPSVKVPPSTRASIALHKGARAQAYLKGRDHVIPDDVKSLAPFVFQHRIFLTSDAISEDLTPQELISQTLSSVPVPKE